MECAKKLTDCLMCRKKINTRVGSVISQLPDASQLQLLEGGGRGTRGGGAGDEVIELVSSDNDE
jgi:hypothetical protein